MKNIINTELIYSENVSPKSVMSDDFNRSGTDLASCLRDIKYTDDHTAVIAVKMNLDNFAPMMLKLDPMNQKLYLTEATENGTHPIHIKQSVFYTEGASDNETSEEAFKAMKEACRQDTAGRYILCAKNEDTRYKDTPYKWITLSGILTKTWYAYFNKAQIPESAEDLCSLLKVMAKDKKGQKPAYMVLRTDNHRQAKLISLYSKKPKCNPKVMPILKELMSFTEDENDFVVLQYMIDQSRAEIIFAYKERMLTQRYIERDKRSCIPAYKLYVNYGSGDKSYLEAGIWFQTIGSKRTYYEPITETHHPVCDDTSWHEIMQNMSDYIEKATEEMHNRYQDEQMIHTDQLADYIKKHLDKLTSKTVDRRALSAVIKSTDFINKTEARILNKEGNAKQIGEYSAIYTMFECLEAALDCYKTKRKKNKSVDDLYKNVLARIFAK